MLKQSDNQHTGAHPTTREFVDQLVAWDFTRRRDEGVHTVFRGPRGGTLRVVRSLLGRADPALVEKAARLLSITTEQFWAGPNAASTETKQSARPADRPQRQPAERDRVTALVLGIHANVDRPLGFDQVVELARGRVTRAQVSTASAVLCREGDLDRIRSGVYQWAGGVRALLQTAPGALPRELHIVHTQPASPLPAPQPERPTPAASTTPPTTAAQLFDQLFPAGIRMTADVLADFDRWSELTEKLVAYSSAS
jgi:hypothetical protein